MKCNVMDHTWITEDEALHSCELSADSSKMTLNSGKNGKIIEKCHDLILICKVLTLKVKLRS